MQAPWTEARINALLATRDDVVANALVRLFERDQRQPTYEPVNASFLRSLAEQVISKKRDIETGQKRADTPLLSESQLDWGRKLLPRYATALALIAAERTGGRAETRPVPPANPTCTRCGALAYAAYSGVPYCSRCVHDVARERMQETEDQINGRPKKDVARCEGCRSWFPRTEPEQVFCNACGGGLAANPEMRDPHSAPDYGPSAVVRDGNNLRWQTQRERNIAVTGNRLGIDHSFAKRLAEMPHRAAAIATEDSPFDCIEECH